MSTWLRGVYVCRALLLAALAMPALAQPPRLIAAADFEDGRLPAGRWHWGQYGGTLDVSRDRTANYAGSKGSVRGRYPIPAGGKYAVGSASLEDLKTREIYIEFQARMPGIKHGLKFLKIFGGRDANGYANATIQPDYTGSDNGGFLFIGFGDGSVPDNDFGSVINIDGTQPRLIGRSYGLAEVKTPQKAVWPSSNWGTGWHHFRVKVKFNSGTSELNEENDGEFYLEIDDKVYVDAKGLFNRHPRNLPIASVNFFDWSQSGTQPFDVWYDDIVISTGGFLPRPRGAAP
jgi:hypothetical protein